LVTDRFGRRAAVAALRQAFPCSWLRERATEVFIALGDAIFALLIALAGLIAWSPRVGVDAARETVATRRKRRSMIREFRDAGGKVWARQAMRNSAIGLAKFSAVPARRPFDP
jgi:hypothetical protein